MASSLNPDAKVKAKTLGQGDQGYQRNKKRRVTHIGKSIAPNLEESQMMDAVKYEARKSKSLPFSFSSSGERSRTFIFQRELILDVDNDENKLEDIEDEFIAQNVEG